MVFLIILASAALVAAGVVYASRRQTTIQRFEAMKRDRELARHAAFAAPYGSGATPAHYIDVDDDALAVDIAEEGVDPETLLLLADAADGVIDGVIGSSSADDGGIDDTIVDAGGAVQTIENAPLPTVSSDTAYVPTDTSAYTPPDTSSAGSSYDSASSSSSYDSGSSSSYDSGSSSSYDSGGSSGGGDW